MNLKTLSCVGLIVLNATLLSAQTKLTLCADKANVNVSPTLYGLMTEEINYSYEGGLYSQLIRNSSFKEFSEKTKSWDPRPVMTKPSYWSVTDSTASDYIVVERAGFNRANWNALQWNVNKEDATLTNCGFWGYPIRPNTLYKGAIYLKSSDASSIQVCLKKTDGSTVYALQEIDGITDKWQKFDISFTTASDITTTSDARFCIVAGKKGKYMIDRVTLFPPTFNNAKSGLRPDLMKMMQAMNPKFLRFPGGNYVEGNTFSERFDWKRTIGEPDNRPGHQCPWGYRSSDGIGLLEFLNWTEGIKAEPLLAVFAGYTLNHDYISADYLQPFVEDALDEIEYVIGGPDTKWGAQRVKDGHPDPFPLHYVEIGNEDFFDYSGSYPERYMLFYNAIKAKYPQLQVICTVDVNAMKRDAKEPEKLKFDVIDEHYYRSSEGMYQSAFQYDSYDRKGPKIFCGEWASREGKPTTNMNAALGDAAWMSCMERNSDILVASCYAPLFVRTDEGGMQWESDLIGYNTLDSYGSPSYYAQVMFANNVGDKIIPVDTMNIPKFKEGNSVVNQLYYTATKDSKTGTIFLKLTNAGSKAMPVNVCVDGIKIGNNAVKTVLKSTKSTDTNSIDNPKNIIPTTSKIKVGKKFNVTLEPYSINVITLK